jgi:hypothetical protein
MRSCILPPEYKKAWEKVTFNFKEGEKVECPSFSLLITNQGLTPFLSEYDDLRNIG